MSLQNDHGSWLKRGRQRAAIAQVLRKPMTATQICRTARAINPRIQLRDVWFLMRQFAKRDLATCLNPKQATGRLYCLTDQGRRAVSSTFRIHVAGTPEGIEWRKYSWVVRAKIRLLCLGGLGRLEEKTGEAQTATEIRKQIRVEHAVGLNPVIRALQELLKLGLVQGAGVTKKQRRKLYRLTTSGKKILDQLKS
jgi:predicted transcriptional regulator